MACSQVFAASELVLNGSFEVPSASSSWSNHPDGPYLSGSIPTWNDITFSTGAWRPILGPNTFAYLPDGVNAGFTCDGINNAKMSQDLHHTLSLGEALSFSVFFGDRADLPIVIPAHPVQSQGTARLFAGTTEIANLNFVGSYSGQWVLGSTSFAAGSLDNFAGQNLSLSLESPDNSQASWDMVSVQSSVPEPMSMVCIGLLCAWVSRRKANSSL